jgi:hypothetical protein
MLEYTQDGGGVRLMMPVHHDDATREYAYGPESKVGTFSNALMAEANKRGWVIISMKNDWKRMRDGRGFDVARGSPPFPEHPLSGSCARTPHLRLPPISRASLTSIPR